MKEIPLSHGKVTIVDDDDYEWLNQHKWAYLQVKPHLTGYAVRSYRFGGKKISLRMHREIMGCYAGDKIDIDHINDNGIDNRRCNLRRCSRIENAINRRKQIGYYSSVFIGVSWNKRMGKWESYIIPLHQKKTIGYFHSEEDAARARDEEALKIWGNKFVRLNFPKRLSA